MPFNILDKSLFGGKPIELYTFNRGLNSWTYTNNTDPIEYQGIKYSPAVIKRDKIKQTSDIFKDSLKVELPSELPLVKEVLSVMGTSAITLTIYRGHAGDNDFVTIWKGRVVGTEINRVGVVEISCESIYTSIRRQGLSAKFEYICRHAIYGEGCGVNREAFLVEGNIASLESSIQLLIPAAGSKPSGWFNGGIAIFSNGNTRYITSHVGSTIVVSYGNIGVSSGSAVKLYPGCNHTIGDCKDKFHNVPRFGGFPWIPSKNPYGGSSIV